MNRYIFDDDGFLIIETKWGNIVIEQSTYETTVQLINNESPFHHDSSHVENKSYAKVTVISMVADDLPKLNL